MTPNFVLPVDAVEKESLRWLEKPSYNRVLVSCMDAGVLAHVTRSDTRENVEDSDDTLIINCGELDGGTLATHVFVQRLKRPCPVVQLDHAVTANATARVIEWIRQHGIRTLNVAGPRESKRPGIYRLTRELLDQSDASNVS